MAKQKSTSPPMRNRTKKKASEFDDMVQELESICDVSFNKRHNLFVDKYPFEVRLCSVDSTNILAYFCQKHTSRDCEYVSQSSLMHDLVATSECPKVSTFIENYG